MVKALFADPVINKTQNLGAVNSINWARILAQITYYFHSYFTLLRLPGYNQGAKIRFVVPTGNFGDVLAGYFAKRMGLPIEKLVVATNENDILDRFWKTGKYEKHPVHGGEAKGGLAEDGVKAHSEGVKETLSPAMDILVSSNFERLLWFLALEVSGLGASQEGTAAAGERVKSWLNDLKSSGGFGVDDAVLQAAKKDFESERVSDQETVATIRRFYVGGVSQAATPGLNGATKDTFHGAGYILDPHSAVGIAASLRSIQRAPPPHTHHVSLATAHPAKFANAVDTALHDEKSFNFDTIIPDQFVGLEKREKRVRTVGHGGGWEGVRAVIEDEIAKESSNG